MRENTKSVASSIHGRSRVCPHKHKHARTHARTQIHTHTHNVFSRCILNLKNCKGNSLTDFHVTSKLNCWFRHSGFNPLFPMAVTFVTINEPKCIREITIQREWMKNGSRVLSWQSYVFLHSDAHGGDHLVFFCKHIDDVTLLVSWQKLISEQLDVIWSDEIVFYT